MSMNMPHPTISKPNNKPVGTIPTYGVPSASFLMTGGIPRGGSIYHSLYCTSIQLRHALISFPYPYGKQKSGATASCSCVPLPHGYTHQQTVGKSIFYD